MANNHTDITTTHSDQPSETDDHVRHKDGITDENVSDGKLPDDHRSKDMDVTNPTNSDDELGRFSYLQTRLRMANLEDATPIEDRSEAEETAIEREFDAQILNYTPASLAAHGLSLEFTDWPIPTEYVRALVLRFARDAGYRDFVEHLDTMEATRKRLDLDGGRRRSALSKRYRKLTDDQQETIEAAAIEAVNAAYRAGDPFPEVVWNRYAAKDNSLSPIKPGHQEDIEAGYIPDPDLDAALDNWAERLLEDCLLPVIDFDRTDPKYPISSFIGLFAHAAIEGDSLRAAARTAGRDVGYKPVPVEDTVMQPVRETSVRSIEQMFQDAHAAYFDSASEYGVLKESKLLGFDPTDILRFGSETDDPWVKGNAPIMKGDVEPASTDQKWEFGVLAFTDPELYFAIGLFPLAIDLGQADMLTRTLRGAIRDLSPEVDTLVMDAGLYGNELIESCRRIVGDDWMLRAPSHRVDDILANATEGEHDFIDSDDLDILKLDDTPNAVVVALYPWESNSDTSHLVILTDRPEDEVDPVEFKKKYQNRCRIEHTIGTMKNRFDIPHNEDVCTEIEYFTRYLSMIFYNHWVQVNNCLSPKYAYPLGANEFVAANRVLHAIRDVAFEKATHKMVDE